MKMMDPLLDFAAEIVPDNAELEAKQRLLRDVPFVKQLMRLRTNIFNSTQVIGSWMNRLVSGTGKTLEGD